MKRIVLHCFAICVTCPATQRLKVDSCKIYSQIADVLGNDLYHIQRYNVMDSAIKKIKGTDVYILPPIIFPSDPLDTMDIPYLNYSNVHIVSPVNNPLTIDMYNDMYFDKPPTSRSA